MNQPILSLVYTCPDNICWVNDKAVIIVVNKHTQQTYLLRGIEFVIWDWLMLGNTYARLVQLIASLLAISLPQAKQQLHHQLQIWQQNGLLEKS
jgi:hypothetical protein